MKVVNITQNIILDYVYAVYGGQDLFERKEILHDGGTMYQKYGHKRHHFVVKPNICTLKRSFKYEIYLSTATQKYGSRIVK